MQYTYLGRTGVKVSRLCLGCMSYVIYREEEREMIPLCQAEGIAVIPWSPLARGLLAGTRMEAPYQPHAVRGFD